MTGICPYARGFEPHDLTCDLAVAKDADLPWWRRLARAIAGRHDCPHFNGDLPCERYESHKHKEDK